MFALLAAVALANPAVTPSDRAKFSLWEGQVAPMALGDALEGEAALNAQAYDGSSERHALRDSMNSPVVLRDSRDAVNLAKTAEGLFVSVQLNLDPSLGPLKDALADLGTRSGFRPDARFEPLFLGAKGERAAVWGWLDAARLSEALRVRGVERVEVSRGRPHPLDEPARGRYVVGIRLRAGDQTPAPQVFARVTRELAEAADFRWRRTIGYQSVPGSEDLALIVLGDAPLRELGAVMGHPDVVKMRPLADTATPVPSAAQVSRANEGFLDYSMRRAPQLVGLTALVVFLTLRRRRQDAV